MKKAPEGAWKERTALPLEDTAIWTIYLCFWLAVLGAVLGSFLDCAVSRWASGDPHPFRGRSRCTSCGRTLRLSDLVPVFSWLFLKGRCRYCGDKIPAECLAAELGGAVILVSLGLRFGPIPALGQWVILAGLLLAVSLTDRAKRIIPDKLLLLAVINRAAWFLLLHQGVQELLEAAKACVVPAALLILVLVMERLLGREAMGGGDIKLLFVLALYLNWAQLLLTLLVGCLLGIGWAASTGGKKGTAMPFGPFLAAGAGLALCCGDPLLDWYFSLF